MLDATPTATTRKHLGLSPDMPAAAPEEVGGSSCPSFPPELRRTVECVDMEAAARTALGQLSEDVKREPAHILGQRFGTEKAIDLISSITDAIIWRHGVLIALNRGLYSHALVLRNTGTSKAELAREELNSIAVDDPELGSFRSLALDSLTHLDQFSYIRISSDDEMSNIYEEAVAIYLSGTTGIITAIARIPQNPEPIPAESSAEVLESSVTSTGTDEVATEPLTPEVTSEVVQEPDSRTDGPAPTLADHLHWIRAVEDPQVLGDVIRGLDIVNQRWLSIDIMKSAFGQLSKLGSEQTILDLLSQNDDSAYWGPTFLTHDSLRTHLMQADPHPVTAKAIRSYTTIKEEEYPDFALKAKSAVMRNAALDAIEEDKIFMRTLSELAKSENREIRKEMGSWSKFTRHYNELQLIGLFLSSPILALKMFPRIILSKIGSGSGSDNS